MVFVDEDNGDVDDIPSDGEGLDGDDETSDESGSESSDVSGSCPVFPLMRDILRQHAVEREICSW